MGEFGNIPADDPRWLTVMDNTLAYLRDNNIGGAYWAGGPWWGDGHGSIEPTNNFTTDKPQMSVLSKY